MKHVQESLYQFENENFFNSLLEENKLSPAEKKAVKDKIEKQGFSVVQKCIKNFDSFKKHAGDIWQEYRDFWSSQKEADESVQQKGRFYNLWESNYIVGVVKEPNGTAFLKVFNTSSKEEDEYVAFETSNPEVIKAFLEFINDHLESTMKDVIKKQKAAMEAKKIADEARQKEEAENKKQAKLNAFLSESKKSGQLNERKWEYTIDLGNMFEEYEETDNLENFKHQLEGILEDSYEELESLFGEECVYELSSRVVDELQMADDEESIDYALQNLYDWADDYSIWIKKGDF